MTKLVFGDLRSRLQTSEDVVPLARCLNQLTTNEDYEAGITYLIAYFGGSRKLWLTLGSESPILLPQFLALGQDVSSTNLLVKAVDSIEFYVDFEFVEDPHNSELLQEWQLQNIQPLLRYASSRLTALNSHWRALLAPTTLEERQLHSSALKQLKFQIIEAQGWESRPFRSHVLGEFWRHQPSSKIPSLTPSEREAAILYHTCTVLDLLFARSAPNTVIFDILCALAHRNVYCFQMNSMQANGAARQSLLRSYATMILQEMNVVAQDKPT